MVPPVSAAASGALPLPPAARAAAGPGLDARTLRNLPAAEQVKAAAGQFEAILLRQFLQESVGKIMGGESGTGGGVYGYMLTDVLASQLTAGGGLGLGRVIERQLMPRTPAAPSPTEDPASR